MNAHCRPRTQVHATGPYPEPVEYVLNLTFLQRRLRRVLSSGFTTVQFGRSPLTFRNLPPSTGRVLAAFILRPWRWRQCDHPKRLPDQTMLHPTRQNSSVECSLCPHALFLKFSYSVHGVPHNIGTGFKVLEISGRVDGYCIPIMHSCYVLYEGNC